jgi:hypothetical protein
MLGMVSKYGRIWKCQRPTFPFLFRRVFQSQFWYEHPSQMKQGFTDRKFEKSDSQLSRPRHISNQKSRCLFKNLDDSKDTENYVFCDHNSQSSEEVDFGTPYIRFEEEECEALKVG